MGNPQGLSGDALLAALDEVMVNGAPAQGAHAAELRAKLDAGEGSPALMNDIALLVAAYRDDPYLWR